MLENRKLLAVSHFCWDWFLPQTPLHCVNKLLFSVLNRYLCPKLLSVLHLLLRSCTILPSRSWRMLGFVLLLPLFLRIHPTHCLFRYSTKWCHLLHQKTLSCFSVQTLKCRSWLQQGLQPGQEVGSQCTGLPLGWFSLGLVLRSVPRSSIFSGCPLGSIC